MRSVTAFVVGGVALLAGVPVGVPAAAAPTDDTTVTFTVTAGTLDIAAHRTAVIGSGTRGAVVNVSLGAVTVTDGRGSADASWVTTVTATDFTTRDGIRSDVVYAAEIDYWSGPATAITGNGTFTPGQATFANRAPLDTTTPITAFTHTGGTGNNTAVWHPGISIRTPLDSKGRTYTGAVTHSVA